MEMVVLAIMSWASVVVILWIVVRTLRSPGAGFGAAGWRGHARPRSPSRRTGRRPGLHSPAASPAHR